VRKAQLATRSVMFIAVPLLLAGVTAGAAPAAPAAAAQTRSQDPLSSVPFPGQFYGVAATSAGNAWAVGYEPGLTLIQRWNGKAWKAVPTLTLGPADGNLYGVAATSASNAWAVGYYPGQDSSGTLIAHWNGKTWKQVPSPNQGPGGSILQGVAATSAANAWAVGETGDEKTVIVHWNGKAWKRVRSPSPGLGSFLYGVTATSATNAWAVGYSGITGPRLTTLILHWNGKTWTRVPSPSPAINPELYGVTATSANNAWAVGRKNVETVLNGISYSTQETLILHWNGKAWKTASSPNPRTSYGLWDDQLNGVTATSASNAWAVGTEDIPGVSATSGSYTMILHWNGKAWKQVPSPNPFCATCDSLFGVAATSARSAWAVGTLNSGGEVVILRWNGTRWTNSTSANLLG
jgi:hypothetical protein